MAYYATLGLERSASTEEVKRAYRKFSLKWHPERNDAAEAEATFAAVAEAYDVLSHSARRAIYDQFGDQGLKHGVPDANGGVKGGTYTFGSNAREIFSKFFGTARRRPAAPCPQPAARGT
jgi:DnaJ-class molecular chaperone